MILYWFENANIRESFIAYVSQVRSTARTITANRANIFSRYREMFMGSHQVQHWLTCNRYVETFSQTSNATKQNRFISF